MPNTGTNQEQPGAKDVGEHKAFTLGWGAKSWNDGEWGADPYNSYRSVFNF